MQSHRKNPVVVVLGATGTGKSKLAVDLAAEFNGEVISADSMQVYKGLDILTNKVTEEEMKDVPHHMISVVDHRTKFDVTNFRNMALPIVENLHKENKIPVIVGGTNYYIESLIWKILIDKTEDHSASESGKRLKLDEGIETISKSNEILAILLENSGNLEPNILLPWSNSEIHSALELVDPARAKKFHPNDRRKIIRSLQVFYQTGRTHSDLLIEQSKHSPADGGGTGGTDEPPRKAHLGGPLRFENVICLWIQVPNDILETRIYKRVDEMRERGLRQELEEHMDFLGPDSNIVFTEGLLQSIGFKEFEDYLHLQPDERKSEKGDKLFLEGAQRLQLVTRQYARKQLKWIRQRFLRSSRRQVPPVYWVDGSQKDPTSWENNVTSVAVQILKAYLSNDSTNPILKEKLVPEPEKPFEDDLLARSCPVCDNRILLGTEQWEMHLGSYKHKKMAAKKRKLAQQTEETNVHRKADIVN
ncbi:unnamed protein product [Allacma fusca]|uniref:tRNA dimethylallyltransferase n=1 Tax=Allacma fusca TaxID=39272 RepID=A0A8J2NW03_9HEXA|nr:unnamed protein product [Allacma fusca]